MRRKGFIFSICFCLILAVSILPSSAEDAEGELMSPGLCVIAARYEMVVSGVPGGEVVFSREDFVHTLGYKPESITLTSRPDSSVGQLTLGSVVIPEGQTLSLSNLDRVSFMPSGNPAADTACFSFSAAEEASISPVKPCMESMGVKLPCTEAFPSVDLANSPSPGT